jgi:hypothetical protein
MSKTSVEAPPHLDWLVATGKTLKTACGTEVDVLDLKHANDEAISVASAHTP